MGWHVVLLGEPALLRDGARVEARGIRLERASIAVRLAVLSGSRHLDGSVLCPSLFIFNSRSRDGCGTFGVEDIFGGFGICLRGCGRIDGAGFFRIGVQIGFE